MGLETHKIVTGKNVAKIAAQEAEDLTEVVIQLIQDRLQKVPQINEDIKKLVAQYNQKPGGGRYKAKELKAILEQVKYGNDSLYRVKQNISNEIGALNRHLGELLTAKGREKYLVDKGLFDDLFEGVHSSNEATIRRGIVGKKFDLFGSDLADRLGAFEGKLSSYKKAIKAGDARFTVGHHQHLAGLRELAVTARARNDPKWWGAFVRRIGDMGYDPGDLGIIRIDPITHKPYSSTAKGAKSIVGILGELGITEKTPGFNRLEEAILARSAHAGGTGGVKIPQLLAFKTPEEAVEFAKPWLEVEKGHSDQAVRMTSKLKSWQKDIQGGKFKNTEDSVAELIRRVEREPILDLGEGSAHDVEQMAIRRQLTKEANLDRARIQTQNRVAPKLPGDIATVTRPGKAVYKAPGIGLKDVKNLLNANPLLKRGIKIGASLGKGTLSNVGKASAGIDPLMLPGNIHGAITKADIPGKIISGYKAAENILGTLAISSKLRPTVGTPAALLAIGSAVGEMQAGGAKWMRELGIHNKAGTFGTATSFPVNPFMPTEQQNKKEEENPLTIANN